MYNTNHAEMVELVDTRDLKSLANYWRAGSTPALGTTSISSIDFQKENLYKKV